MNEHVDDTYIITRPQRPPPARAHTVYGVMTVGAWMLYLYLWLPLITLVAWALGLRSAYVELYLRKHSFEPRILLVLLVVGIVATVLLIGWAEYNRRRFHGRERRTAVSDVTPAEVAEGLGVPERLRQDLTDGRFTVLRMGDEGRPLGIGVDTVARPAAP